MAVPERLQEVQESLGSTLGIQDRGLVRGGYRHGNFGRIRVEAFNKRLPLAGGRDLEGVRVFSDDVRRG